MDMSSETLRFRKAGFGLSKAEIGRRMGVSRPTVSNWFRGVMLIPAERLIELERVSGIPREQLRPDLYRQTEEPKNGEASTE